MVDIIKRLCKEKGTSVAAIEKQCGLGNGSIRKWDNAAPSLDRAMAVANALGVSVSYLTGETDEKKPTPEGEPKDYAKLTPENQRLIDQMIAGLLAGQSQQ